MEQSAKDVDPDGKIKCDTHMTFRMNELALLQSTWLNFKNII